MRWWLKNHDLPSPQALLASVMRSPSTFRVMSSQTQPQNVQVASSTILSSALASVSLEIAVLTKGNPHDWYEVGAGQPGGEIEHCIVHHRSKNREAAMGTLPSFVLIAACVTVAQTRPLPQDKPMLQAIDGFMVKGVFTELDRRAVESPDFPGRSRDGSFRRQINRYRRNLAT